MTNKIEYNRALIFLERKTLVHVKKIDGIFHNGLILEVADNFFVLKDMITGKEEFILFEELEKPIKVYTEVRE